MNKRRGQGAIEFMIVFGFMMFAAVVFIEVIQDNQTDKNKEKEIIIVQNIALDVQDEIALASESTNGYYREFNTPVNLLGKDYNITLIQNYVFVGVDDYSRTFKILNVTGNVKKGLNTIKKENGTVYLNQ